MDKNNEATEDIIDQLIVEAIKALGTKLANKAHSDSQATLDTTLASINRACDDLRTDLVAKVKQFINK